MKFLLIRIIHNTPTGYTFESSIANLMTRVANEEVYSALLGFHEPIEEGCFVMPDDHWLIILRG